MATLYYGTNKRAVESFKIIEVEYDYDNDYYTYTFYDRKRDRYGIIIYFRPRRYLSMQYVNQRCSLDYIF
ncbi:MAG TPA: hypothetical protein PK816_10935 [Candidatus Cloacimonadota bacterium]|nr:hypothetical protein [Candidatus Cloacimonadota bacterium]